MSEPQPHRCECSLYHYELRSRGKITEVDTNCEETSFDSFARGHDAKLKSLLIAAGCMDLDVFIGRDGIAYPALSVAVRYGFGHQVRDGIIRAKAAQVEQDYKAALDQAEAVPQNGDRDL